MPMYDYYCSGCEQLFTQLRPMAESGADALCTGCGDSAQRVISAPRLATMNAATRQAHQVNEKSAHAPRMSQKHVCGSSCSHGSGKPALKQSTGTKRPWMIGH